MCTHVRIGVMTADDNNFISSLWLMSTMDTPYVSDDSRRYKQHGDWYIIDGL
jgi:hypothetical protein